MIKISITGKANSGKNTTAKLMVKSIFEKTWPGGNIHYISFADPLKRMLQLAFPQIPRRWLYGSSEMRSNIIPGAFKDGIPLTVRQGLIDLGNEFGRRYQHDIWIKNLDTRIDKLIKKRARAIVVTDCRFRNEFDYLKNAGFFSVRLLRNDSLKIDDVSETNQDGILDSEFDAIIHNDGSIKDLKAKVYDIVLNIKP